MVNDGINLNLEHQTYNNVTGEQQDQTQPITILLAYQVNGTDLPSSSQPAPRLVIVGSEGLVIEGSGGRSITQISITGTAPTPTPTLTISPTASPAPTTTPTATPQNNENSDQTFTYLIAAAVVIAIVVVVLLVFVLTRKK
jgi:hypothetical protein